MGRAGGMEKRVKRRVKEGRNRKKRREEEREVEMKAASLEIRGERRVVEQQWRTQCGAPAAYK